MTMMALVYWFLVPAPGSKNPYPDWWVANGLCEEARLQDFPDGAGVAIWLEGPGAS